MVPTDQPYARSCRAMKAAHLVLEAVSDLLATGAHDARPLDVGLFGIDAHGADTLGGGVRLVERRDVGRMDVVGREEVSGGCRMRT